MERSLNGATVGLAVSLALGCASGGMYVRPGFETICSVCDPAAVEPETLEHRVVLVGDAGEPMHGAEAETRDANFQLVADSAVAGKTTVVFLGDNIYPRGLPQTGESGREASEKLLDRQLALIGQDTSGVVVPGNHDWDRSGRDGLPRIREQADYVYQWNQGADGFVQFQPEAGCPGPVFVDVGSRAEDSSARVRLVFFDSEWLLRDDGTGRKQVTGCSWGAAGDLRLYEGEAGQRLTIDAFAEKLTSVTQGDRDVVLLSHHPLETAGSHGGRYPWYLHPTLYPLIRYHIVRSRQDLSSSINARMRKIVETALAASDADRTIHASGHEHGLQVFEADRTWLLVSGSGSKAGAIGKTSDTIFKHGDLGFMTLDYMTDDRILLRVIEPGQSKPVLFSWVRP